MTHSQIIESTNICTQNKHHPFHSVGFFLRLKLQRQVYVQTSIPFPCLRFPTKQRKTQTSKPDNYPFHLYIYICHPFFHVFAKGFLNTTTKQKKHKQHHQYHPFRYKGFLQEHNLKFQTFQPKQQLQTSKQTISIHIHLHIFAIISEASYLGFTFKPLSHLLPLRPLAPPRGHPAEPLRTSRQLLERLAEAQGAAGTQHPL